MVPLTSQSRILVATQPADFRKGIDGFVAQCRDVLQSNPRSGALFVFINRRRTMVRILVYEGHGYWLMTKRLSKGTFQGWPTTDEPLSAVLATQLRQLVQGQEPTVASRPLHSSLAGVNSPANQSKA